MSTWYSVTTPDEAARLVGAWPDAPFQNEELCTLILDTAREQVEAYAPDLVDPIYEPATITWPNGQKVTLTRSGEIATAVVEPGGVTVLDESFHPWPADHFKPDGEGLSHREIVNTYILQITDNYGGAPNGLAFATNGAVPPFASGVVRWVADPAPGDGVPSRWVYAQLQQARNLWNAGRTTGEGDVGPDGFVFRPYPLDKTIKQIIRPVDGVISVL